MTTIDGDDIAGATIDGDDVQQITVDGDVVFEAGPPRLIDSFEDQDLSEYSGNPSLWHIDDTQAWDGTYALSSDDDEFSIQIRSQEGDGASYYPQKGDIIRVHMRATSTDPRVAMFFGLEDADNYYVADLGFDVSEIRLLNSENGSVSTLDTDTVSVSADTWYRVEVVWDDGTLGGSDDDITVRLIDMSDTQNPVLQGEASANDPTHAVHRGIGFRETLNTTGNEVFIDHAITAESQTSAEPATVEIDSFDDGDLNEYGSDPAGLNTQQATVHNGSHALQAVTGDSGTEDIYSTSGLNAYPGAGDEWEFYVQRDGTTSGDQLFVGFCQQGSSGSFWNDGWYIRVDSDGLRLRKDNSTFSGGTGNYAFPTNEWTRVRVRHHTTDVGTNEILVQHYDESGTQLGSDASTTDTDYQSGNFRIAVTADLSDNIYVDTFRII